MHLEELEELSPRGGPDGGLLRDEILEARLQHARSVALRPSVKRRQRVHPQPVAHLPRGNNTAW
jgi:hypothetical protein